MTQQHLPIRHEWQRGARMHADPNAAAQQLAAIADAHDGAVPLTAVVESSRDPNAPLHHDFEWSDPAAAHLYRIHQAGYAVRSLRVVTVDLRSEEEQPPARSYIPLSVATPPAPNDAPPPAHTYIPVVSVAAAPDRDAAIRLRAVGRIQRLADELRSVPATADLAAALDALLDDRGLTDD